jgi:hypothetical protein
MVAVRVISDFLDGAPNGANDPFRHLRPGAYRSATRTEGNMCLGRGTRELAPKTLLSQNVSRFTANYMRRLLSVLAVLALAFCLASSAMALSFGCRWSDLTRTTASSGAYVAIVRQQDCDDHFNYSIRLKLPGKWFMDVDLENETDKNEDEPSIKWTAPLTLEIVVRTETLKGTIESQTDDYDSPNSPKITIIRRYIPR